MDYIASVGGISGFDRTFFYPNGDYVDTVQVFKHLGFQSPYALDMIRMYMVDAFKELNNQRVSQGELPHHFKNDTRYLLEEAILYDTKRPDELILLRHSPTSDKPILAQNSKIQGLEYFVNQNFVDDVRAHPQNYDALIVKELHPLQTKAFTGELAEWFFPSSTKQVGAFLYDAGVKDILIRRYEHVDRMSWPSFIVPLSMDNLYSKKHKKMAARGKRSLVIHGERQSYWSPFFAVPTPLHRRLQMPMMSYGP